ncbi:MAG: glycosyltransferase family 39 protein, partial [Armatimonadetes bacterium]|nr:glycosyltransferase family 39 protein [Armatimonadota bacterium]
MRALLFHLAWMIPCAALFAWFFSSEFKGLTLPEAMDMAQVGRHISEGEGFTTSFVRPLSLAGVARAERHPDIYNAPLYPLVLAVAFNVLGANDRAVGSVSLLFGMLTALFAYFVGARLVDQRAGALSAVLVSLSAGFLYAGVSGLNITLLAFLITLGFYLILRHSGSLRWSIACGAVWGLTCLTEYTAVGLIVPAIVLVVLAQRELRLKHAGAFAVGLVVILLPWMVRNWIVIGGPLTSLKACSIAAYGTTYPVTSLYRYQLEKLSSVAPMTFMMGNLGEVGKKLLLNLGALISYLPRLLGLCVLPLVGVALVLDLGSGRANRLKWGVVASVAAMGAVLALTEPSWDRLYGLYGVAAAIGASALVLGLRARQLGRGTVAMAIVGLLALGVFPIGVRALSGQQRPADRPSLEYLAQALPADAVVVTDDAPAVAWYSDRIAVWIPYAPTFVPSPGETPRGYVDALLESDGYKALGRSLTEPGAIFLSSGLRGYSSTEGAGRWQQLHSSIAGQLNQGQAGETLI